MELPQTNRAKMPHGRPDSMDSFDDDYQRDYENVDPSQAPPQHQVQPQWQEKAKPVVFTSKAAEHGRKSLVILYVLMGASLLVSTAALVLILLKWLPYCPQGWEEFQRNCYFFSSDKESWEQARISCNEHTAELAVISNQWEQTFLAGGINSTHHWIGLSNEGTEGSWLWVDGSPVSYTSWSAGNPDVNKTLKICVRLTGRGGAWSRAQCETRYNFVCERAGAFWA
ncbi:perlucin-like isoform X1 [Emydura macquarii macquarii]|uniref:perlucin-like isoform X1 n=1 Tax=Emydura macquarii macquarii TaxID=1129001 RepID=UPI00352A54D3